MPHISFPSRSDVTLYILVEPVEAANGAPLLGLDHFDFFRSIRASLGLFRCSVDTVMTPVSVSHS